jgi:D-glycero-alpha-D-manno-heptose-7-phosphate kinase
VIISRTPVRIPLGGGGTDLPAYYEKYESSLLTAAVNRYVFIIVKKHFEDTVRFTGYHRKEVVDSSDQILHPVVRTALRLLNIGRGIEIVSVSDVPANAGLGASSSFTVGILNALHTYKGENPSPEDLAKEALTIERGILKEPGGIQDQYIAAYGGLIAIDISRMGKVAVRPLKIDPELVSELERRLVFFYTKLTRTASEVQAEHVESILRQEAEVIQSLHGIKQIGFETKSALETGDLDRFGKLLDEHWNYKKRVGGNISNGDIDRWHRLAIDAGALGGKLLGAGGGGFLTFYCQPQHRDHVRGALAKESLKEIALRFEPTGSRIILNI